MIAVAPNPIAAGVPVHVAEAVAPSDDLDSTRSRASTLPAIERDTAAVAIGLRSSFPEYPTGLANALAEATVAFPLRVMIVDNSGSMQAGDGQRLCQSPKGGAQMLSATRWQELADDVVTIASMAEAMNARTDFHLLNPRPGFDALSVAADSYDRIPPVGRRGDLAAVKSMNKTSPGGTTPLTEAVMRVVAMIEPKAQQLRASGELVCVIIATDGLPNDPHTFQQAMMLLQALPVWLVVRLCTDDDKIVDFWNRLDEQLEAPLEVLDDLRSEADEIHEVNPWVSYAPSLHAARLFGLPGKLYDALDETRLTPSSIKEFVESLLGGPELPEPELDIDGFLAAVKDRQAEALRVLNPRSMKLEPWLDLRALERAARGRHAAQASSGCVVL